MTCMCELYLWYGLLYDLVLLDNKKLPVCAMTTAFNKELNTGIISAKDSGRYSMKFVGPKFYFGVITASSIPLIKPTSCLPLAHTF